MFVTPWLLIECCHDRNQPVAQYLLPCRSLGNYMYMTEPPKADKLFVFRELDGRVHCSLHAALILHLLY